MRIIIYNGKGGVGKTSVAAATARRSAKMGYRTMIMSVDTAHSLGDSLDVKLSSEIVNVEKNLDALELNIIHEMRTKWSSIRDYISAFMLSQGVEDISAEEMAILPGMEMVAALFYVLQFKDSGSYDVVIIDTAPTGETLRLLSFPDVSNWYIDKIFGLLKRMVSIARMTVGRMIDIPLPSKEVMESIEDIKNNMERVKEILEDHENTTIRLVLNPERMPINETMRSYTYLCLYNKTVECLIVNKVLPDDVDGSFMRKKLEEQEGYMKMIHEAFEPLKIMYAYQLRTELRGSEGLDAMADMIFGDSDPTEVYASTSPMHFTAEGDIDKLHVMMPFVEKKEIELFRGNNSSIIIRAGSQKRAIALPMTLVDAEMLGAEFDGAELVVKFRRKK
ncbi:putative arsenical pump-driving ATPase [Candidatus Methanoplasma termitum]|uniref:Putative arsenical pump-driving ATPase n=1 Tax=Candidatus Methanoplasma termitum TaxID=1577791 RepID=A0A0A7LC18_9ARCH|nr:ArsA family ATPase [Candidatus Methanoplasma termitum]AIZ56715.1 putative arsenical pump-driving ATPase [Candidatus Methanoplasma termitum]MCL2333351.1 ArsA family ATPase [Candidatus Methanoplasma sp.]